MVHSCCSVYSGFLLAYPRFGIDALDSELKNTSLIDVCVITLCASWRLTCLFGILFVGVFFILPVKTTGVTHTLFGKLSN